MALCGIAMIYAVALVLLRLGASRERLVLGVLFVAVSPVALGPVSLNTYDLWPAALTVGAVAALAYRRGPLALGLIGAAFAAKLYPLALVGPAAWYVWRVEGGRRARVALAWFVGIAAAFFVPFAALGASGLGHSLRLQLGRPLHAESLGASLLLAADKLGLYTARIVVHATPPVSRDLTGPAARTLAIASSVAAVAAVLAVWVWLVRGRPQLERVVAACAAAAVGFLAFGKVFSPQYAEWLVPLVPLVAGSAGALGCSLLLAALVLAQVWYFHYPQLWSVGWVVWPLLVRNLVLVGLYCSLLPAVRLKTRMPSSSKTSRQSGFRRSATRSFADGSGEIRSR
jgi:hypothetical protein